MPSHDVIDERFDELVAELRAAPPGASPELRRRVQVIARQDLEREQPVRPPFSRRPAGRRALRGALALAAFALVVVAIVGGLLSLLHGSPTPRPVAGAIPTPHASAGGRRPQPYPRTPRRTLSQDLPRAVQEKGGHGAFAAGTGVGVNPRRLQQYAAWLRIRVRGLGGLSTATKRAMRLTRSYGGYVASVSYNVPGPR